MAFKMSSPSFVVIFARARFISKSESSLKISRNPFGMSDKRP